MHCSHQVPALCLWNASVVLFSVLNLVYCHSNSTPLSHALVFMLLPKCFYQTQIWPQIYFKLKTTVAPQCFQGKTTSIWHCSQRLSKSGLCFISCHFLAHDNYGLSVSWRHHVCEAFLSQLIPVSLWVPLSFAPDQLLLISSPPKCINFLHWAFSMHINFLVNPFSPYPHPSLASEIPQSVPCICVFVFAHFSHAAMNWEHVFLWDQDCANLSFPGVQ